MPGDRAPFEPPELHESREGEESPGRMPRKAGVRGLFWLFSPEVLRPENLRPEQNRITKGPIGREGPVVGLNGLTLFDLSTESSQCFPSTRLSSKSFCQRISTVGARNLAFTWFSLPLTTEVEDNV